MHAIAAQNTEDLRPAFDLGPKPRMAEFLYRISCALNPMPEPVGPSLRLPPGTAAGSKRVRVNKSGATIIEYSMLVGLVALAAVSTFQVFGGAVGGMFSSIASVYVTALN